MSQEHEDKQLIERAQANPEEYAALYSKYVDRIFQYIYYKTGQHRDTAEDLTAEVFLRAMRNLEKFTWQGHPYSSYLYQIARSVCQEQYARSEKATVDIEDLVLKDESPGGGNTGEMTAELRMLWDHINALDPPLPEIFQLRYIEDLPFDEIGIIVGKKAGAVRTALSRATKKLQEAYA